MRLSPWIACLLSLTFVPATSEGGVYRLSTSDSFDPFIVVHPPGYDGSTGGVLEVRACVSNGLERTAPAVRDAIDIWNALTPMPENCTGCAVWEEPPDPALADSPFSMSSVLVHELGHCVFGLDHVNWPLGGPSPNDESSFTNTDDATTITAGTDGVRGSSDDEVSPLPGAGLVHWFRRADNNPFVIDSTVIDSSTYSRRIVDLMALGHAWAASGNRIVGESLGLTDSQAVMYSLIDPEQRFVLSADDVSTVAFGMSGFDETAGTGDDYTVQVVFSRDDCTNADVEIRLTSTMSPGVCLSDIEALPGGGIFDIHHVLVPFLGESRLLVSLDESLEWDLIFADGFESGTTSSWSASTP